MPSRGRFRNDWGSHGVARPRNGVRIFVFHQRVADRRSTATPAARPARGTAHSLEYQTADCNARGRSAGKTSGRYVVVRASSGNREHAPCDARSEVVPVVISKPLKIGIGGPVGSGKTALVESLCTRLKSKYQLAGI